MSSKTATTTVNMVGIKSQVQYAVLNGAATKAASVHPLVLDIGGGRVPDRVSSKLKAKLTTKDKFDRYLLPNMFFSDDRGLELWKDINRMPDYYQTRDEIELLERHGSNIASHFPNECTIIDLGCGDVRKVSPLLEALQSRDHQVHYYGLDLSKPVLESSIKHLRMTYPRIRSTGLWGTFEDGLAWSASREGPKIFLSLGSIFGNERFERAVRYLKPWARAMGPEDRMLIGIDVTTSLESVWNSYHDSNGMFEEFIRNAFLHSNKTLGKTWYRHEDWELLGRLQEEPLMHRFVLRALRDVDCPSVGLHFPAGEEIECYESHKQTPEIMRMKFERAGLHELASWSSSSGQISKSSIQLTGFHHGQKLIMGADEFFVSANPMGVPG